MLIGACNLMLCPIQSVRTAEEKDRLRALLEDDGDDDAEVGGAGSRAGSGVSSGDGPAHKGSSTVEPSDLVRDLARKLVLYESVV